MITPYAQPAPRHRSLLALAPAILIVVGLLIAAYLIMHPPGEPVDRSHHARMERLVHEAGCQNAVVVEFAPQLFRVEFPSRD